MHMCDIYIYLSIQYMCVCICRYKYIDVHRYTYVYMRYSSEELGQAAISTENLGDGAEGMDQSDQSWLKEL